MIEGYFFYESKERGLGSYFLDTLYSLKISGGVHRKTYQNLHRSLSKRFPFAIYYSLESETVRVKAIVDCRRNPSWIRGHLGNA
ncbi:hypothetical protein GCM10023212_27780 [Luteolibacter yonseiensis]